MEATLVTAISEFEKAWSQVEQTEERKENFRFLMKTFGATEEEIKQVLEKEN